VCVCVCVHLIENLQLFSTWYKLKEIRESFPNCHGNVNNYTS